MGIIHKRFITKHKQAAKLKHKPGALKTVARSTDNDVIICRCEKTIDGETYGPFTASVYDKQLSDVVNYYKDNLPAMPEPGDEGLHIHHGLRVGLEIKDFVTWFPNVFAGRRLSKAGFQFNIYTLHPSKIQCGKTQVVYHPDNAIKLASMDYGSMMSFYERWVMKKGRLNENTKTNIEPIQ